MDRLRRAIRSEYLSIGLLWAAIVAFLFREALLAGPDRILGGNDVTYAYLPWLRFTVESVKHGIFPLWNPYVFSGTPFAGNPQTGLFYPATWLALWVGPERALGLSVALHVWLAAMGTYAWLREMQATRAGALLASIAYALSGFTSARIWGGHYGPLLEAALLPMLLWLTTRALHRRSIAWAIVAGVPFGLMILAGHTPTFVLLALGAGVYILFEGLLFTAKYRTRTNADYTDKAQLSAFTPHLQTPQVGAGVRVNPRPKLLRSNRIRFFLSGLGLFALTAIVGVALAAIQILPALTFVENSARVANLSAGFAARFSMPPAQLLQMLVPDLFGEPLHAGYWGAPVFEEYVYYVGVPTLILTFLSLFTRNTRARFFVAFGVFGLIVSLGPDGGAYLLLYRFVPLFDLLRAPARAGMWTMFCFAAAAGLCLSALQTSSVDAAKRILSRWPPIAVVLGVIAGLGGAALAYAQYTASPSEGRLALLAGDVLVFTALFFLASLLLGLWRVRPDLKVVSKFVYGILRLRGGRSLSGAERSRRPPAAPLRMLAVNQTGTRSSRIWPSLLIALLLIDLGAYQASIVQMTPSQRGAVYAAADRALGDRLKDSRLIWVYADLFELNLGMDFGQYNVYGYDSLITARLQALVDRVRDLSSPIYDMLNVRYVVSQTPLSEPVDPIGELDGVFLYERLHTAPRAWIVHAIESVADDAAALDRVAADFDPQATAVVAGDTPCAVELQRGADSVAVTRYEPNRIEAQIDAASAGLLVFSEIDYPGWVASIDGVPAAIHRVDYGLRGVCVPAGSHRVSMIYDPPELKVGVAVSAATLLIVSGVMVALAKRR